MTHYKTTTDGRIDWPELSAEERELLKARTRPTPDGGNEEIEEYRIELSQYDLDHLNAGQPVFKGIGDDIQIVLYSDAPLKSGDSDE